MLQELQDEVEDSSSTMSTTLKKLDKLIEKSGVSSYLVVSAPATEEERGKEVHRLHHIECWCFVFTVCWRVEPFGF